MPIKILVADAEEHIALLVQANLTRQGFDVIRAHTAEDTREKIATEKPDGVILGDFSTDSTNFELLKELRQNPETEPLFVMILSKKDQDKDIFEGNRLGADIYLTKPFNPQEVVKYAKCRFPEAGSQPDGPNPQPGGPDRRPGPP